MPLFILFGITLIGNKTCGQHKEYCGQSSARASFKNVVDLSDSSFVAILDYIEPNDTNITYLKAFSTTGRELWDTKDLNPSCRIYQHLRKSTSGMLAVYGHNRNCSANGGGFIHIYDEYGNLHATADFPVVSGISQSWESAKFTTMPWGYALWIRAGEWFGPSYSIVYGLNEDLQLMWETQMPHDSYLTMAALGEKIALSTRESIVLVDSDGEDISETLIPEEPNSYPILFNHPGFGMLMLDSDSLFVFTPEMTIIAGVAFPRDSHSSIHVSSTGQVLVLTLTELKRYSPSLELLEVKELERPPGFFGGQFVELAQNIVIAGTRASPAYFNFMPVNQLSEAWYYYDFEAGPNTTYPDIAVTNVELFDFQPGPDFTFSAGAIVEVENMGNVPLDGFWLNHLEGYALYRNDFSSKYYDVYLNVGESVEVTYENFRVKSYQSPFHDDYIEWYGDDFKEEVCIFSSSPGGYIDRNHSNDDVCLEMRTLFTVNPNDFKAYPNPVLSSFRLGGLDAPSFYRIFDLSGRIIQSGEAHPHRDISLRSNITRGLYIVQVEGVGSLKIIVK